MDASSLEADLRRQPTSRRLTPDEPKDLLRCRPGPSRTNHAPSHIHELRQLEPEEDLIQLSSRPPTPYTQINSVEASVRNPSNIDSDKEEPQRYPRLQPQVSLLDLEDPPSHEGILKERTIGGSGEGRSGVGLQTNEPIDTQAQRQRSTLQNSGDQLCNQCERYSTHSEYCNACDSTFCTSCWRIIHKTQRKAPGSIPHEKTDIVVAKKINAILQVETTSDEQDILHRNDEDTTWFGVVREDAEPLTFRDYGRYASIMADTLSLSSKNSVGVRDHRYPSLVSFVGQTGAGKSTIIRMLIDLITKANESFPSPVVGATGLDLPTSGDVHLYSDPQTSKSDNPILYADCEGLEGGERVPLGARFKRNNKGSKSGRTNFSEEKSPRVHTSEREITWADTNVKRGREFAVTHLYPRLLYTFSDVIVFVLNNPRVIESVFEKLVNWAAAALEKSSNQPVLPHAIIVLNAEKNDIDPALWDIGTSTSRLLRNLSRTVNQNATFKKYAQFWRERDRPIETVEQLLHSYYRSVSVVRVPTSGRPNLIRDQVGKLYTFITVACDIARERKAELRMLLDAYELQPYLQYAFDHFACDLDSPFDFVQASFTNSPIPLDFGGNILKLAIILMNIWENAADCPTIFKELSYMVASCIMLDSARSKIRGTARQIFPQYVDHLDDALENFCDRHWPCEYVKSKGGARCVNVRSGHSSKGHQRKNGKVLAVGGYVSSFSFNEYCKTFQNNVYSRLEELLRRLRSRVQEGGEFEAQAAAEIHKEKVLVHFYSHSARGRPDTFNSHSMCLSCLFEPPEHALPCGHIICTPCLRAYGRSRGRTVVEIDGCPLELLNRWSRRALWRVSLKPNTAGIRILTLDGGGIRGIVELEILRQIEKAMGGRLAIQCFFELIVGTSTGGLIALGLATKNWSVEQCTRHFEDLCKQAFTRRTGGNVPGIGWWIDNHNHSMYKTRPLQEVLMSAYSEHEYLFGGSRPHAFYGTGVKVAVTATSASGSAVVLANYNRLCEDKLPYHFQRPEALASELKIWEAARATSAAPRIFKPFCHGPSKQVYTDGALCHNNPTQIADKERKLIWPELENECPDLVVSVGTTYNSAGRLSTEKAASFRPGVFNHGKALYKIAVDHIASALDSEKAWHSYMDVLQPPFNHRAKYIRINPQLNEDPPHLHEVDRMTYIQDMVRGMLISDERISKLALRLIASSFYFEKSQSVEVALDGRREVKGNIHCRLLEDSQEISELGKFLRNKIQQGNALYFIIREEYQGRHAKQVCITNDMIERMVRKCQFKMSSVLVELSNPLATTEILLHFGAKDFFPISRFPRSLLQDEDFKRRTRPNAAVSSNRWAGRTLSQLLRRKNWVPPDLPKQRHTTDRISYYSGTEYIIGEASQDVLRSIADRLTNGPTPVGAVPELDSSEIESEMAELTMKKSVTAELWGGSNPVELEPTPIFELEATPIAVSELDGSMSASNFPSPIIEPDDLQPEGDSATHQATTADRRRQQAYSILTKQGPSSEEQGRT